MNEEQIKEATKNMSRQDSELFMMTNRIQKIEEQILKTLECTKETEELATLNKTNIDRLDLAMGAYADLAEKLEKINRRQLETLPLKKKSIWDKLWK